MTTFYQGLDIASPQAALDLAAAKKAIAAAVIYIKIGGDNAGRYVAPHYKEQVDRAIAAGFTRIGHYWVPGRTDPTLAALYATSHLHRFNRKHHFVVLDNETLDTGHFYGDADAAEWVTMAAKGAKVGVDQVFTYMPAAPVLRAFQWPKLEAVYAHLALPPIIAFSYGENEGVRDHEPNMGGRFDGKWAGHQYTSHGRIPGFDGFVDLDVFKPEAFAYEARYAVQDATAAKPKPKPAASKPAPAKPASKPKPARKVHKVRQGETLISIARDNHMSLAKLEAMNRQIKHFDHIKPTDTVYLS